MAAMVLWLLCRMKLRSRDKRTLPVRHMFGRFISYFLNMPFQNKKFTRVITVDWTEIHFSHLINADVDNNALQRDELITRTPTLTHIVRLGKSKYNPSQYNGMSERRERYPHT